MELAHVKTWALVLASLVLFAACGDPNTSVRLRNESTQDLYVWTRSAGQYSPIFRIDHGRKGAALSVPGHWVGEAIVLTLTCEQIATVPLSGDLPTVVIEADGTVNVLYGEVPYVSPGSNETLLEPLFACGVTVDG